MGYPESIVNKMFAAWAPTENLCMADLSTRANLIGKGLAKAPAPSSTKICTQPENLP